MATPPPAATPPADARNRLTIELAPAVAPLLDHVSGTLGVPKAQVLLQALLDALPQLLERADLVKKRADQLAVLPPLKRK